jgi:DNA-binding MarR family transcriptional regulator
MSSRQAEPHKPERLHIGQLLVHLTRLFQTELYARLLDAGIEGARVPHTHVTAYITAEGSRLTDLATQARMTRPAMAELVDDLQRLGIVERRPDPSDGRAKLICLTDQGWAAMRTGHRIIAELEAEYARLIGDERFETMCQAMQALLDANSTATTTHDPGQTGDRPSAPTEASSPARARSGDRRR